MSSDFPGSPRLRILDVCLRSICSLAEIDGATISLLRAILRYLARQIQSQKKVDDSCSGRTDLLSDAAHVCTSWQAKLSRTSTEGICSVSERRRSAIPSWRRLWQGRSKITLFRTEVLRTLFPTSLGWMGFENDLFLGPKKGPTVIGRETGRETARAWGRDIGTLRTAFALIGNSSRKNAVV
jgi:hypothetical protein